MSDTGAAWLNMALHVLEILGGVGGTLAGMAMVIFRRTFATRDDLAKHFNEHAREHHELEARLASGENRFVALSGAIEMVRVAAEQAKRAAEDAHAAADHMTQMHVEIADLRGDIKAIETSLRPIERLTMNMVEGHMDEGRSKTGRPR